MNISCLLYTSANKALGACGYPAIPLEQYRYLVGNGAKRLMYNMLDTVAKGQYTDEDIARLRKIYDALYEGNPTYIATHYPGMPEIISELKKSGFKLAVLSNKPHNCTTAIIDALFPAGTFDRCYGQRPEVERKPSPQGALLIAEELRVLPERCLYIGDTNTDMKTGNAAGMDTCGVLWGFRDREELEENHACYIIEQPRELLAIAGKR